MVHIQKTINRKGKLDMAGYGKKKGGKKGIQNLEGIRPSFCKKSQVSWSLETWFLNHMYEESISKTIQKHKKHNKKN